MTGKLVGGFSYELQAISYKCGRVGAKKSFALLRSFKANGLGAFSVGQRPTTRRGEKSFALICGTKVRKMGKRTICVYLRFLICVHPFCSCAKIYGDKENFSY